MTKKFFYPVLVLIMILSAVISGCTRPISAQDIANRTVEAIPKVDSVKMDMHATLDMSSSGGETALAMSMTQEMTAEIKTVPQEMHAVVNTSVDMAPLGKLNVAMEMYLVDRWMYTATEMLGSGKQWMKTPLTGKDWQSQNQLQQQAEFLRSAMAVTMLGTETVDGVDCYVLEVKPDLNALMEWVKTQQINPGSGMDGPDVNQLDLAKMFKTYTMKEWITKDGYLLKKAEVEMVMELSEQDFAPTTTSTETMTVAIKANISFYDYNKPLTITVPPEALTAQEVMIPAG